MRPSPCQLTFTETSSPPAPSTGIHLQPPATQGTVRNTQPHLSQLLIQLLYFTFSGNSITLY